MRTIDADALKKHKFLTPDYIQLGGRRNGKTIERIKLAYQKGWNDAIDAIYDNAPTVVKENLTSERPTGEWIKKIDDVGFVSYICSSCGFELELEDCSDSYFCSNCGAKMKNTNTESEEKNMKEMTVEQYRERLIEAFQNTGCGELIALVCLPNEEAFKALESLLRNFWNKKEEGEEE